MTLHKDLTPEDIHSPYSFVFTDHHNKDNLSDISNDDVGKLCWVVSDQSIWVLVDISPRWLKILDDSSFAYPKGPAGGDLGGVYPNPSVTDDSHRHTPGVTIPDYPSSLPPTGPAGGDLEASFPNPKLKDQPINPGQYNNPTIRVDKQGRITYIYSNELGQINEGKNLGLGTQIYLGMDDRYLVFRTLNTPPNSGIRLKQEDNQISIINEDLAKLSGANFNGEVTTPKLTVNESINVDKTIYTKLFNSGIGASWTPDVTNGNNQFRVLAGNCFISSIRNIVPGTEVKLIIKQNSIGNHQVSFSDEYKFAEGEDKSISLEPNSISLINILAFSNNFYITEIKRKFN